MIENDGNSGTIHDRIAKCVQIIGKGKNTLFAEKLGISEGNIRGYIKGVVPKADVLEKIVTNCDISSDWLLTGRGDMLKTKRISNITPSSEEQNAGCKDTKEKPNQQEISIKKVPEGSPEGIPLIPLNAMAGALTSDQTVLEYECERYVVPAFKGADFLIPVKGSSMYPKYSSGDIVACQRVPMSGLFFQWNKVYVIDTTQGPLIKRIKPGSTPDNILIVSDNAKYDPFELPLSSIHAVALVIGVIRLE